MKRRRVVEALTLATLMSAGMTRVGALEIDVLSQWYSIDGYEWGPLSSYTFSESGTSPVFSPFSSTHASGNVGGSGMFLEAKISFYDFGTSQAKLVFRAKETDIVDLVVNAYYSGADARYEVGLTDNTAGTTLLSVGVGMDNFPTAETFSLSFEAGHLYELIVDAYSLGGDGSMARISGPLETSVPDPSSSSLLLGIGIAALGWMKKRLSPG